MKLKARLLLRVLAVYALVFLSVLAFLNYRYYRGLYHDSFDQHLSELAGFGSVCCSSPNTSPDWDEKMQLAMVKAFAAGKPFWGRDERHYENIHTGDGWDCSEGFIYTTNGEMFQLTRYPPTFFRAARIVKYQLKVPKPTVGNRSLNLSNRTKMKSYRLYP